MNDNSPYFNEKDVYITVSDDTPIGSFVTRLFAFDDDSEDKISYSVGSDPSGQLVVSITKCTLGFTGYSIIILHYVYFP